MNVPTEGATTPPANLEAEQALLGAILINNQALERVSHLVTAADFHHDAHRRIFQAIEALVARDDRADPVTLKAYFSDTDLDYVGGTRYFATLASAASIGESLIHYAKVVREFSVRRQLLEIATRAYAAAGQMDAEVELDEILGDVKRQVDDLAENSADTLPVVWLGEAARRGVELIERAHKGEMVGVPTGIAALDAKLGGLRPGHLILLAARPSMGKAQPMDSKVLTASGWRRMGDLRPGDRLASIDGQPSSVVSVHPQGVKQIYRVTFSDGRTTECCADHLWRVHHRKWATPRILTTAELIPLVSKKCGHLRYWIDTASGDFGEDTPLPIDPWILGVILGDGGISSGGVRFSTASPSIVKMMREKLGSELTLRDEGRYSYAIVQLNGDCRFCKSEFDRKRASHRYCSEECAQRDFQRRRRIEGEAAYRSRAKRPGSCPNRLKDDLAALGLLGLKSERKFIPEMYLNAPRRARVELLRGLMDTDGWVERHGTIMFSSTSKRLSEGVAHLARSLGWWASIRTRQTYFSHRGERKAGLPSWVVTIAGAGPEIFSIPEKVARASRSRRRRKNVAIASILPSRMAPAQCIRVSHPSHLYITDDYVVTHNTSLALYIGLYAGKWIAKQVEADPSFKSSVLVISCEMKEEELGQRSLAESSGVAYQEMSTGRVSQDEFQRIFLAQRDAQKIPVAFIAQTGLKMSRIRAAIRQHKRRYGCCLVIIDYIGLLKGDGVYRAGNRVAELSEITEGLKAMAGHFDIPVLALAQLNRDLAKREDKRPQLHDLRDSGSLEQDADEVIFLHRDQYYLERSQPELGSDAYTKWLADMERVNGIAELIIAKNRHGGVGTVRCRIDLATNRFFAEDHQPDVRQSGFDWTSEPPVQTG